ncbi:MAG: hypothetical protein ACJ8F1_20225 [Polyangia bacterium]
MTGRGPNRRTAVVLPPGVRDFATFERTLRAATAAHAEWLGRSLTQREVAALANELLAHSGSVWELNAFEDLL